METLKVAVEWAYVANWLIGFIVGFVVCHVGKGS